MSLFRKYPTGWFLVLAILLTASIMAFSGFQSALSPSDTDAYNALMASDVVDLYDLQTGSSESNICILRMTRPIGLHP